MEAYLVKEFHCAVVVHANTIHARVDGKMIRSLQTLRISCFCIGNGKFGSVNRGHDVVVQKQRDGLGRRFRQHQDRLTQASVAQLNSLIDRGDTQVGCARSRCSLCNLNGAMAVCVSFNDGKKTAAASQLFFGLKHVVLNCASIDLYPRPTPIVFGDCLHFFLGKRRRRSVVFLRLFMFGAKKRIKRIGILLFGFVRKASKAIR